MVDQVRKQPKRAQRTLSKRVTDPKLNVRVSISSFPPPRNASFNARSCMCVSIMLCNYSSVFFCFFSKS